MNPEHDTHIRVSARYTGRVQGVGFRATATETARGYEVTGFVTNEPDGSVHLEAQGLRNDVEGFLDAVRERMSTLIDGVSRLPLGLDREERGFEIRY
ncbi:MAG: acylphosphatase [Planctomycetota bacterium]